MKIITLSGTGINHGQGLRLPEEADWHQMTDSNVLQGVNPFFVPDFAEGFEAVPGIGFRIERLGKGIGRRFAKRYYSELTALVNFRPVKDGILRCNEFIFDKSVGVGRFAPIPVKETINVKTTLKELAGKSRTGTLIENKETEFDRNGLLELFDEAIERVSAYNTVKTGDTIAILFPGSAMRIREGERIETSVNDDTLLSFNIK